MCNEARDLNADIRIPKKIEPLEIDGTGGKCISSLGDFDIELGMASQGICQGIMRAYCQSLIQYSMVATSYYFP